MNANSSSVTVAPASDSVSPVAMAIMARTVVKTIANQGVWRASAVRPKIVGRIRSRDIP